MPQLDKQLRKLLSGNNNALNIPSVNIGDGTFTPVQFTPQEYTPQQEDLTLLANSLNKMEERKEKLDTQRLAVAEAFSKAREVLPDNEETNAYITENQDRIMNDINSMIDLGDMSNALSVAKTSAAKFVSSPEFNARVEEHKARKEWLEGLNAAKVPQYVKDYYRHIYEDKNNFTYDKDGKVTGTAGWEAPTPEAAASPTDIIAQALKLASVEKTNTQSSWGNGSSSGSSHFEREWITPEKISETAKTIVDNNPDIRQAYIDQFNAGIYQISTLNEQLTKTTDPVRAAQIENQIKSYESSFYKNGAPYPNAESYINNLFDKDNKVIQDAAHDWKVTATSNHTGTGGSGTGVGPVNAPIFNGFNSSMESPTGNPGVMIVTGPSGVSGPPKKTVRNFGSTNTHGLRVPGSNSPYSM